MEAKIKGMESYKFEKRMYPHPSSPEALKNLSHRYGIILGGGMYEAFQFIRNKIKNHGISKTKSNLYCC